MSGSSTATASAALVEAGNDIADDEVTKRRESVEPRRPRIDHLHLRHDRVGPRVASSPIAASSPRWSSCATVWTTCSTRTPRRCCSCRSRTSSAARSRSARSPRAARSDTRRTSRTCSVTWPSSSRRSCWPCRGCSRRSTTPPSSARTASGKGKIFDRAEAVAIAYSEATADNKLGAAGCCGSSTPCSTGLCTASCARRSAATASPRCPAVRRSAPGSATSSAASA